MAREPDALAGAAAADTVAEQIALHRVDESGATPQPETITKFWVQNEYDELAEEQRHLHDAEAEELSRDAGVEAAGVSLAAAATQRLLDAHETVVDAVTATYVTALTHLTPYRRRPPKAKIWHRLAKGAFLIGDVAGIATAAIWLGEIPALAVIMALAAATAVVTAGISGAEVRDVRDRARRAPMATDLPPELAPYRHLFEAPDRGWPFVKALLWVSVAVAATVASAIFGLRASIEDPLIGLVFGGIAASIAAASWIESFCYADAVADAIDSADHDLRRESARHQKLAESPVIVTHQAKNALATSIREEQRRRGEAAGHHMQALLFGILRRNPQTAGNGPAAPQSAVGQTTRRRGEER